MFTLISVSLMALNVPSIGINSPLCALDESYCYCKYQKSWETGGVPPAPYRDETENRATRV